MLYQKQNNQDIISQVIAGLGALGVALQNYTALVLFIKDVLPVSLVQHKFIHLVSLAAGGLCSGWINFLMNLDLLKSFFNRVFHNQKNSLILSNWEWFKYYLGILVFIVTGILFGLMAFTFALEGILSTFSIAAGIFVAIIMTIQEVETWISSYEEAPKKEEVDLSDSQIFGLWFGYIIAFGNVLTLSLLFTLSLAQSLMMFNLGIYQAYMFATIIAFSFGAFTEYFFYHHYLSNFCKDFSKNYELITATPNWKFGLCCVLTNALVNAALAYAGIELLFNQLTIMPLWALPILSVVLAFFAGTASLILGLKFWMTQTPQPSLDQTVENNSTQLISNLSHW